MGQRIVGFVDMLIFYHSLTSNSVFARQFDGIFTSAKMQCFLPRSWVVEELWMQKLHCYMYNVKTNLLYTVFFAAVIFCSHQNQAHGIFST